jgi:deoxyribodipyrimidine photo-lyase
MTVHLAAFTRDLRIQDNPVLRAACDEADQVVPVFVRDPRLGTPARAALLDTALADLDASLRERGGHLVLRHGDVVEQLCRAAAETEAAAVHIASDDSPYAKARERRLRRELEGQRRALRVHHGVHTVHSAGSLTPAGKDHFAVFTPYWRRWSVTERRPIAATPKHVNVPGRAGRAMPGGGRNAPDRLKSWVRKGLSDYGARRDDMAADATSRLSADLHLGTVSAVEVARACWANEDFVRQLAWRDFHHQVLAARPDAARGDYRARPGGWRRDEHELQAWTAGQTGYPLVDAGMRQLLAEGWMHNRARLVVASLLTKTLMHDWREGADHFNEHLVDGDVANNVLNWQWVAGTGTDTRPNRVLNPVRQGERYDPSGDYVRRWVPELAHLPAKVIHQPWTLPRRERAGYPDPIVDLADARTRFTNARK